MKIKNLWPKTKLISLIKNSLFKIKGEILSSCIDGRYNKRQARLAPRSLSGANL